MNIYDEWCKKWFDYRRCTQLIGGQCEGQNVTSINYLVSIDQKEGKLYCNHDEINDNCLSASCELDTKYANLIIQQMWEDLEDGRDFTSKAGSEETCPTCDICIPADGCQGIAPDLKLVRIVDDKL